MDFILNDLLPIVPSLLPFLMLLSIQHQGFVGRIKSVELSVVEVWSGFMPQRTAMMLFFCLSKKGNGGAKRKCVKKKMEEYFGKESNYGRSK